MYRFPGYRRDGFTTMVILSSLLHLVIFIPFLYLKEASNKVFIAPAYTVDLVSFPREKPKRVQKVKKKRKVPKVKKKTKKKEIKEKRPKINKKKEIAKKKTAAAVPQLDKAGNIEKKKKIADALKEIKREATLKEEDLKTKKVIERIEDREKDKEETRLRQEFERLRSMEKTGGLAGLKDKVERLENKRRIKELELKTLDSIGELREKERLREEDIRDSAIADLPVGKGLLTTKGVGSSSKLLDIQFADYYTKIWKRIQKAWIIPKSITVDLKDLETIVGIKIGRNGDILRKRIEKSSGNIQYDEFTLRAIEKSAPLPPLPEGFRGKVFDVGIRFRCIKKQERPDLLSLASCS